MKRKKKDLYLVKCNRIRLDLPPEHPFRKRVEANQQRDREWQPLQRFPGCFIAMEMDHRKAIDILLKIDPELLKKADLTQGSTSVSSYTQLVEGQLISMLVMAKFFPPDEDDPDRIETGWAVIRIKGPFTREAALREEALRLAKGQIAVGNFDHYVLTDTKP